MSKKILIICTGNSCRSQMAEGFLKSFDPTLQVFSAGTKPATGVNPKSIIVMKEVGIDISRHKPDTLDKYLNEEFDFVITVCDSARQTCPIFTGNVKNKLHIGFEDPADATGSDEEVLPIYRKIRDQIKQRFFEFFENELKF